MADFEKRPKIERSVLKDGINMLLGSLRKTPTAAAQAPEVQPPAAVEFEFRAKRPTQRL